MKQIPGGNFKIARKIYNSPIWLKPPLFLKIWLFILGKASHTDTDKNGFIYKRGELVTTYDQIIKAVSYIQNKRRILPTIKQIRVILVWLQSEGMILAIPLRTGPGPTGADPTAHTRAYIGIKIVVINYNTYQTDENYRGRHQGRGFSPQGHNNNNGEEANKYMSESDFGLFYKAYPKHEGKKKAFDAWLKIRSKNVLLNIILPAIERQKEYKAYLKSKGEFCPEWPLPATWLNGRRWEDETPEVEKSSW